MPRPINARFLAPTLLTLIVGQASAGLPNGVASGDTTPGSTVLWTRSDALGPVTFQYSTDPAFGLIAGSQMVNVTDPTLPVKATIGGLNAGTQYYYRAIDNAGASATGRLRTPSLAGVHTGFRMGVSGDWRGELSPYPSVRNVPGANLDLWVSLGDTIYADIASPAVPLPQATTLGEFRAKHNEVYSTRFGLNTLADLRASTSVLSMIDDHEVTNDFAGGAHPSSDPRFAGQAGNFINETQLYSTGIQAFHEYNPINTEVYGATGDPRTAGKSRLYRERGYGSDAAVFSIDARSFRDQGLPAADPLNPLSVASYLGAAFTPGRTMLGVQQLADLKGGLSAAQAAGTTWKFVMMPEPIQNLGVVGASDRFEGYAAERTNLLNYIDDNNIGNVVFVSADIHGTLVNNVSYQDFPGGPQKSTGAFEVTTGSVAYAAPFGPTVAGLAASLGLPGALPLAVYNGLPLAQQEAYITALVNAQITPLGYDPLGLQGSDINATLLQGGYTATNSFGWTDFHVDPVTKWLTVTTWGIPWYDEATLLANPNLITGMQPTILSQFVVQPVPAPAGLALLGLAALAVARRRRA